MVSFGVVNVRSFIFNKGNPTFQPFVLYNCDKLFVIGRYRLLEDYLPDYPTPMLSEQT